MDKEFKIVSRQFQSDPKDPHVAQQYVSVVDRTIGYENLTDELKSFYIKANIVIDNISEEYIKYCSRLEKNWGGISYM